MRRKFYALNLLVPSIVALGAVAGACAPRGEVAPAPEVVADPLPSWNEGAAKQPILDFVARVSDPASPDFVPAAERIATFDNDGTLWSERPVYFQLLFAIDRVKAMAAEHPEWKDKQPFKGVLEGDLAAVAATGEHGLLELLKIRQQGGKP